MADDGAQLIGLDWGTTSLRAYLLAAGGRVLAQTAAPWGIMTVPGGDFAGAYRALVAPWRAQRAACATIAAGMIGSTEGWAQAPYRRCPAGAAELSAALVTVSAGDGVTVHIIPGVERIDHHADVMRGEETQIVGALARRPELARGATTFVLPGTHVKWVDVVDGRIERFVTYMTGELYAVLSRHSILSRPAPPVPDAPTHWDAFEQGVACARASSGGVAPMLFATRALVLQGRLPAEKRFDFLSGLLIGDELRSALPTRADRAPILVGEPALCERYVRAATVFGVPLVAMEQPTPAGLWTIAATAGLVNAPVTHG